MKNEVRVAKFLLEMMLIYSFGKAYEETKGDTIQKVYQSSVISLLFITKMGADYKYIYIAIKQNLPKATKVTLQI